MQQPNRHFVRICVDTLPWKQPVYEFGSMEVHEAEDVAYVRDLFPKKGLEYVGCDMRAGPGVDSVQTCTDWISPITQSARSSVLILWSMSNIRAKL